MACLTGIPWATLKDVWLTGYTLLMSMHNNSVQWQLTSRATLLVCVSWVKVVIHLHQLLSPAFSISLTPTKVITEALFWYAGESNIRRTPTTKVINAASTNFWLLIISLAYEKPLIINMNGKVIRRIPCLFLISFWSCKSTLAKPSSWNYTPMRKI